MVFVDDIPYGFPFTLLYSSIGPRKLLANIHFMIAFRAEHLKRLHFSELLLYLVLFTTGSCVTIYSYVYVVGSFTQFITILESPVYSVTAIRPRPLWAQTATAHVDLLRGAPRGEWRLRGKAGSAVGQL